MPNDLIIKVSHIECAIGSELKIDGAKPSVIARKQIGHLVRFRGGSVVVQAIAIDSASHHIATQQVPLVGGGKRFGSDVGNARDCGAPMQMLHGRWNKAQAIVRATETWVATTAQELRDRFAMAIGGKPKAVFILGHPERVDLSLRVKFDARPVRFESEDIPTGHLDRMPIGPLDLRDIVETVASVDPTVSSIAQSIHHAVRIARGVEGTEQHFAFVADSIAIGVAKEIQIGDRKDDRTVGVGEESYRNVKSIGEGGFLFVAAIPIAILEDDDRISACC